MISINHLHKEILERQSKRNTIYEEVFLKIIAKIKYTNSRSSECQCLYAVPAFMYGTPLYDLKNCLLYVVNRLREHFFYVKYAPPNILYISWQQRPFTGGAQLNPLGLTPKNGLTYLADSPVEANNLMEIKSRFHIDPESEKRQLFNAIDREFIESSLTGGTGKRPVVAPYNSQTSHQSPNPSLDSILDQLDLNSLDIKGTLL
jgi:hypothetical protein